MGRANGSITLSHGCQSGITLNHMQYPTKRQQSQMLQMLWAIKDVPFYFEIDRSNLAFIYYILFTTWLCQIFPFINTLLAMNVIVNMLVNSALLIKASQSSLYFNTKC